jgi:acetyl esterase/lipase
MAADHLQWLAKTEPLDLTRVIAVGHSAGGHAAAWLTARP